MEEGAPKLIGAPTRLVLKSLLVKVKKNMEECDDQVLSDLESLCQETISTIEVNLGL